MTPEDHTLELERRFQTLFESRFGQEAGGARLQCPGAIDWVVEHRGNHHGDIQVFLSDNACGLKTAALREINIDNEHVGLQFSYLLHQILSVPDLADYPVIWEPSDVLANDLPDVMVVVCDEDRCVLHTSLPFFIS
jgi:hypothetical protein